MRLHLAKMKSELKLAALQIRELKSKRKELKGYVPGLEYTQHSFRAKHIAYCMLRGRTLEQIEPKLRDPNSYHHTRVRKEAMAIMASVVEAMNAIHQP